MREWERMRERGRDWERVRVSEREGVQPGNRLSKQWNLLAHDTPATRIESDDRRRASKIIQTSGWYGRLSDPNAHRRIFRILLFNSFRFGSFYSFLFIFFSVLFSFLLFFHCPKRICYGTGRVKEVEQAYWIRFNSRKIEFEFLSQFPYSDKR